ncbi:hypothetical protein [Streptomyces sp. NPDC046197]|uniref:hypothetical protein n=1 Tax=Streptomyces sp. NPDC046197 TaxID=3154337 RepID=UPI00340EE4C5
MLLAAGGLALAAGVLSLVRLAPESGVGGLGTAEAEPHPEAGTTTGDSTNTAATTGPGPTALPSASLPMGGVSATPASGTAPAPTASPSANGGSPPKAPPGTATVPTTIPEATNPPDHPATGTSARPPATTHPAPRPTPAPTHSTHTPAPQRSQPGLCVPIIGLCVSAQGGPDR